MVIADNDRPREDISEIRRLRRDWGLADKRQYSVAHLGSSRRET